MLYKGTPYYAPETFWSNEITAPIYDEKKYRRALEFYDKKKRVEKYEESHKINSKDIL